MLLHLGSGVLHLRSGFASSEQILHLQHLRFVDPPEVLLASFARSNQVAPGCTLKSDGEASHVQTVGCNLPCPVAADTRLQIRNEVFVIPQFLHHVTQAHAHQSSSDLSLQVQDCRFCFAQFAVDPIFL